jgi:hypothetical protein
MTTPLTIECATHFRRSGRGARKEIEVGPPPQPAVVTPGRLPRVARLMALAIRFDGLVCTGAVKNYAELARLGQVSRARISQITALLCLAPDIQEDLLFLPASQSRRAPILLCHLWHIPANPDWASQRRKWHALRRLIDQRRSSNKSSREQSTVRVRGLR